MRRTTHIRIYNGVPEPEVYYDPLSHKLIIIADNIVILVRFERVLAALAEKDIYCKCYRTR